MLRASLPRRGGPGPSLVLLLLLSLVLSGVLAYQAQDAARSHRAVSESTLRDYAALASEEFARHLDREMDDLTDDILDAVDDAERRREGDGRLDEFVEEMGESHRGCDCEGLLGRHFVLDLASGRISVAGAGGYGAVGGAADTLRAAVAAAEARRSGGRGGGSGPVGYSPRRGVAGPLEKTELPGRAGSSLLYTVVRGSDGAPRRAYGLVLEESRYVASVAAGILSESALLPPSLLRGSQAEATLSVTLSRADEELFHSGGVPEAATAVIDSVSTPVGSYLLNVAVRPEMADRLVIGGLPRSRLPLLLAVFLLSLGLSVVAIVQLRRQQALVRLRSAFVASVSHELRTPLAQIRLFSDLLASGRLGEEQRARSVRIVGEEAQRLAYLVENVLQFSRASQGTERVAREPVDLAALTGEIVETFIPLAQARHARLACSLEPGSVALLDADAVRQVLLNLLDNALKYGPPGQTIGVSVTREGDHLRLAVDDEGPGVPSGARTAVWKPYHRLDRDVEAATGGSGIGLSVVRELVRRHGGRVAVGEAPGGGARFNVWFPAEPVEIAPIAPTRAIGSGAPA